MKTYRLAVIAATALAALLLPLAAKAQPTPEMAVKLRAMPFQIGADISWIPEDEAAGATYFVGDQREDPVRIFKDHGFNSIRLRIFVNPGGQGGYAARRDQAFCDLAHTIAMAKRIKAAGMSFFLDFHYSDTWADPAHQTKPAAWADLSFDDLKKAVHDHTYNTLVALRDAGVYPDMISVGNEISNGMLWPEGQVDTMTGKGNWDQFADLLKAGIAAAREADPMLPIALHHHLGRHNEAMRTWLDNLIKRGVKFDIIASSNYAQATEGDWQNNLNDLETRYPGYFFLCAEYSRRKRDVNDMFFKIPDRRGLGTFIWEPERHMEAIFESQWGGKDFTPPRRGGGAGGARRGVAGQAANAGPTSATQTAAELANVGTNANEGATGALLGQAPARVAQDASTATAIAQRGAGRGATGGPRGGGRYVANDLLDLYPAMAKDYLR